MAEAALPEFDLAKRVGRKLALQRFRRSVVLCVVDAADFDGSLPRNALRALLPAAVRPYAISARAAPAALVRRPGKAVRLCSMSQSFGQSSGCFVIFRLYFKAKLLKCFGNARQAVRRAQKPLKIAYEALHCLCAGAGSGRCAAAGDGYQQSRPAPDRGNTATHPGKLFTIGRLLSLTTASGIRDVCLSPSRIKTLSKIVAQL